MSSNFPVLRDYQTEIATAVFTSILERKGLTFSVEIARQGGKNELSAQIECFLLGLFFDKPRNLIKCSPTFKPQTVISMIRLMDRLNDEGLNGVWAPEHGYIIRLVNARAIFLSADKSSNVVGNTAHILLEIDESQDVNKDKYTKEFKPMGATTNCTTIHYGTTWDEATLLEEVKQMNLEMEKRDGIKRHFRYDWEEIANHNPDYRAYVEAEKSRLGENHPLFLTQYRLLPVHSGGGFFTPQQIVQLSGSHSRKRRPEAGKMYIAGIDLAGEAEEEEGNTTNITNTYQYFNNQGKGNRDATVVTVGELDFSACDEIQKQPRTLIVEHYAWTGKRHTELYAQLVDLLKNVWHCRRVVVDATGAGEPVAAFLKQVLGSRIVPFKFTMPSKSQMGFNLLSAVNSGLLKMYAGDGSAEYRKFHFEIEKARTEYRPGKTINFYVDPSQGHDDFLMSLALLVEAAHQYEPREAKGHLDL